MSRSLGSRPAVISCEVAKSEVAHTSCTSNRLPIFDASPCIEECLGLQFMDSTMTDTGTIVLREGKIHVQIGIRTF